MENIYFRFVTDSVEFPDVPFEAIRDCDKKEFLRELAPVARRIQLGASESTVSRKWLPEASSLAAKQKLTGDMLIIESATGYGSLRIGKRRFGGKSAASFSRLPNVGGEIAQISNARRKHGRPNPALCVLTTGQNSVAELVKHVKAGSWDIVHFCGHSIRSDDDEVFLVLPGSRSERLNGLSMSDFAKLLRKAGVTLLVLSSCEGATSHSLFRLAQEGIPAVIGFRWEVKSSEATDFSVCLHDNLAEGMSLGKAYLHAVQTLTQDRPAFLSSMLVVQEDNWAQA
jgi:CHAT domain-containing protein